MNTPISAADMRRLSENKPISVQDICDRWQISRPTVMAAISSRKLIGDKHFGKWFFHPSAVVEWRGVEDQREDDAWRNLDYFCCLSRTGRD